MVLDCCYVASVASSFWLEEFYPPLTLKLLWLLSYDVFVGFLLRERLVNWRLLLKSGRCLIVSLMYSFKFALLVSPITICF